MKKTKIPGPPSLVDLFEVGAQEEIDKNEKERVKGKIKRFPLSPSGFGSCGRKLAIELAEFEGIGIYPIITDDPRSRRRFSRGHDIEYSLLKQMKQYIPIQQTMKQQYLPMEKTKDGKYMLGGSIDVLLDDKESLIVDIKSKSTYWSNVSSDKFQEEMDEIADSPHCVMFGSNSIYIMDIYEFYKEYSTDNFISRYFLQLNAYGCSPFAKEYISSSNPGEKGVKAVSLLFENKNNHIMAEIRWKPDERLYRFALDKMHEIYQHVVIDKKDPTTFEADFTLGSLNCKMCPRREICWSDAKHPYNGPRTKWAKDSSAIPSGDRLEKLYLEYQKALKQETQFDIMENELIKTMLNLEETKVRFSDGRVFEIKRLKTPKPRMVLRQSK